MNKFIPFYINSVFVITSPRPGEEGVTRRLVENIADASNNGGHFNLTHVSLYSGENYFQFIEGICKQIEQGLKPLIHFDMHGCEERGLEIGVSGEFIHWDFVVETLRILNEQLQNELFVLMTACHGLHTILPISFEKTAPFLCLIAPEEEIYVADVEDKIPAFYQELFATASLDSAFLKLGSKFSNFNCVEFLFRVLAIYIKKACIGAGGRERREELLTQIMQTSLGDTPEMVTDYRNKVKQHIKPDQALLERYTSRFLMGKNFDVRIEELLAEVERVNV
ncbi:TPA: hypothetical protein U8251_002861 [Pseudomonas putida]|nr:hypothetical protein [Pseudomonas putida]